VLESRAKREGGGTKHLDQYSTVHLTEPPSVLTGDSRIDGTSYELGGWNNALEHIAHVPGCIGRESFGDSNQSLRPGKARLGGAVH
jgi:hypothetical protein